MGRLSKYWSSEHASALEAILDNIGTGIIIADAGGKLVKFSRGARAIVGMAPAQVSPDAWSSTYGILRADDQQPVPLAQLPLFRALKGECVDNETYFVRNPRRPQGVYVKTFARPLADGEGNVSGGLVVFWDVTEHRKATEALVDSERTLRTLVENSPDVIMLVDRDATIRFINYTLPEYRIEDVIGTKATTYLSEEDARRYLARLDEVFERGEPRSLEVGAVGPTWWQCRVIPIKNQNATHAAMVIAVNITHQRRLLEEASRAQRLETSARIAGQIAHDFNNMLGPLVAYPQLIREQIPEDHPAAELLDEIEFTANKMAEINQQMLALGRRGHYAMHAINVNDLMEKVVASLEIAENIALHKDFAAAPVIVEGGEAQLTRCMINLLINAREAMEKAGGRLDLRTSRARLDEPLPGFQTVEAGDYARVDVIDTGTGIAAENINRIFDPFFTTKKTTSMRGSGLGLSVVHGIVQDHRGYITVSSRWGEGTTFSIYLPLSRDTEIEQASRNAPHGTERVLVIDDDMIQRRVMSQLLLRLGYQVHTVASGEEAVPHVIDHPYDLIVVDMVMEGIDGAETYRRIREHSPAQKALILSGYARSERVEEAQRLGVGAFLSKPVSLWDLAVAVRQELDR